MKKVITLTLNPSLDRTMITHYLNLGYPNRLTETTRLDPAGHGVNIARALTALGCPTNAVILLGNDATSRAYQALVESEELPVTFITREGLTRSNIIIVDTGNKNETHLIEESSVGTEDDLEAILGTLENLTEAGDMVVLAGRLTADAPRDIYERLTRSLHKLGARVTIAAGDEPLNLAVRAKPNLVALSRKQLEALLNFPVRTSEDIQYAARKLRERGAEKVLVTAFGDQQDPAAILVTDEKIWHVIVPEAETGTLSGVADAMLGGLLASDFDGKTLVESLELAASAAAYTASMVGNDFGTVSLVEQQNAQIRVVEVERKPDQ